MQVNVDSEVDEVEYNVQGKGAKVMEVLQIKGRKALQHMFQTANLMSRLCCRKRS